MSAATMDGPTRVTRASNFSHQRSKSTPHAMLHNYHDGPYADSLPAASAAAYANYAAALSRNGINEEALLRAGFLNGHRPLPNFPAQYPLDHLKTMNLPPSALTSHFELLARVAAINQYMPNGGSHFDPALVAGPNTGMGYVPAPGMFAEPGAIPSLPQIPQTPSGAPNYAPYSQVPKQFYYPSPNGTAHQTPSGAVGAQQFGHPSADAQLAHHHTHSRKRTQSADIMPASLVTPVASPMKVQPPIFQDDHSSDSATGHHSHDDSDPSHFGTATTPGSRSTGGPDRESKKLNLYKTELCRSWEETGYCRYGAKCQFAHSEAELRPVDRHPKYKTEMCKTFWEKGTCPYGKRCCFIHTDRDVEKKMADIERRLIVIQGEEEDGAANLAALVESAPQRSQSVSAGGGPAGAAAAAAATAAALATNSHAGMMTGGHVRSKSLGAPREHLSMLRPIEALPTYNNGKPKSPYVVTPVELQQAANNVISPSVIAPTPTSVMMGMLSPTHHNVHHFVGVSPSREPPARNGPVGSRPGIHDPSMLELGMMLKNVQISNASSGSVQPQSLTSPTRIAADNSEPLWEDKAANLSSSLPSEDSSLFQDEPSRRMHRRIQSVGSGRPSTTTPTRFGYKQAATGSFEQVYATADGAAAGVAAAAAEGSEEVDGGRLAFFKNIA